MGWFDESDSDDDEQEQQTKQTALHPNDNKKEEDEEDPLDAYMKSLEAETSSLASEKRQQQQQQRAERLDVAGEEEATSHWQESNIKSRITEEEEEDVNDSIAKQEMNSMFHKAGTQNDECNSKQVNVKLQSIKHDEVQYNPFEKRFWTPTDTPAGREWRRQHDVTCTEPIDPILLLDELKNVLGQDLLQHIYTKNFVNPTLVQSQTLPVALAGKDAIVTAATGSGKTLAYVWPMVVHVCAQPHLTREESGPIGMVLVPTRELATQVQKQTQSMLAPLQGTSVAVIGGTSRYQLVQDLHRHGGVEVIVATPGRLLDVLSVKKNKMTLTRVTFLVLDEADKMLDMGFESQVSQILKNIRPNRQSLLLSATMGRKVERVAQKWLLAHPARIAIGRTGEASQHVNQHTMVLPSLHAKKLWILEMIPTLAQVGRTLVFVATRADCEALATDLGKAHTHLAMQTLHGDKHQSDRNKALREFSKGNVNVLIATDVAARGLDVANVSTVINYDVAKNLDAHVHRIGRAGRLSKTAEQQQQGTAYTLLVTPKNADFAHVLVNAFEREGRLISPELRALADKSRRSGNVASRNRHNKLGLGYDVDRATESTTSSVPNGESYYGPAGHSPPTKRGRWN